MAERGPQRLLVTHQVPPVSEDVTRPEVTFRDLDLDDRRRAEVRAVIRRIIWPKRVRHVEVVRQFAGGGSGAFVGQVLITLTSQRLVRVIKIAPARELAAEWQAYTTHIRPASNAFCAPVVTKSPEIEAGERGEGLAAIVYDHVGQHAGMPEMEIRTLEESPLTSTVDNLLTGVSHVLHNDYKILELPTSLRFVNLELGPNLTVTVEQLGTHGIGLAPLPDDEVLRRTLSGAENDLVIGDRVVLGPLRRVGVGDSLVAVGDEIKVEIHAAPGTGVRLADMPSATELTVCGVVTDVRGARHRARLAQALASHENIGCADPFEMLAEVLTTELPGRVTSVVHGDLNPRNIVRVGDRPYLIDYARARANGPQQTDFCWLEIGLMRDLLADHGFAELLHLQRCLGLASRLVDLGVADGIVADIGTELVGEAMRDAFHLLLTIRRHAYRCHPLAAEQRWWMEHLRHLYLAAHRTVKWTGAAQPRAKLRATASVASVATEWLDHDIPFRYWKQSTLTAALEAIHQVLPLSNDAAVHLLVDLVTALEAFGPMSRGAKNAIETARADLVRTRCADAARRIVHDMAPIHDAYFNLQVDPGARGAVESVATRPRAILAGPAGSGKSTVAAELVYRLAADVLAGTGEVRMPVCVTAPSPITDPSELVRGSVLEPLTREALVLGAVHVIIDVGEQDVGQIWDKLSDFPRVRVLLCRREAGAGTEHVVTLRPLTLVEMPTFLRRVARTDQHDAVDPQHVVRTLLDDPAWAWVPLSRPRWLALVASHLRAVGCPELIPRPHELIARMAEFTRAAENSALCHAYQLARRLSGTDRAALERRLLDPSTHDAFRILVTLPETTRELVQNLVGMVRDADPVFAAQLLGAAALDAPDFVERMLADLRDDRAGPSRWRRAATALKELGRHGLPALRAAASNSVTPPDARREALRCLANLYNTALFTKYRRTVAVAFAEVLRDILSADSVPDSLLETALEVLVQTGLPGLELFVARFVDSARPWPVVRQAVRALRACGTILPPMYVGTYHAACRIRFRAAEAGTEDAWSERGELTATLASVETLPWLLRRRFAFGSSAVVVRRLDELLPERLPLARLRVELESEDEPTVFAAAHRLLRDTPEAAGHLVLGLDSEAALPRLLVAAEAIPYADHAELDIVERLVPDLATKVGQDRLEGLATLLVAIFGRRRSAGVRLARLAADALTERNLPERYRWPWSAALARVRCDSRVLDTMLQGDEESALAALAALASRNFHRCGLPGPTYRLGARARHRLLALPFSIEWVLAVASANLLAALPRVRAFIAAGDPEVMLRGSARFGLIEQATIADALAVAGYLASQGRRSGAGSAEVAATHRMLSGFDTAGQHPSIHIGRSIGLAYLGDWQPLFESSLKEARIEEAAHNLVRYWLFPAGHAHRELAVWINQRLRSENLPDAERWTLEELKHEAERIGGILVPAVGFGR